MVLSSHRLLQASKYVGSECPEELHDVNARVFEIVYDLATGALQNDDLPERLVQFLTDPAVVKALERHSSYYEPKCKRNPTVSGKPQADDLFPVSIPLSSPSWLDYLHRLHSIQR